MHLVNQSPCVTYLMNIPNVVTMGQQSSVNRFNSPLIELFNHQQALQKDNTAFIFKLSDLQTQHENNNFLAC